MSAQSYINVIVPLRLDWEPVYSVPEGLELTPGDRVSVLFSGKEYLGVVSRVNVTPGDGLREDQILPILGKEEDLPRITPQEMSFWSVLSSYYLCSAGEVYNSVYFRDRVAPRKWAPRNRSAIAAEPVLSPGCQNAFSEVLTAFSKHKTVLFKAASDKARADIYLSLAVNAIKSGKSVIYLVPDIALTMSLQERISAVFPDLCIYNSALTPARRRDIVLEARLGRPMVVLGTRSSLFIPFSNLGLVIVDQEHESSYKQDSPAPRYHARETAIMLAGILGANVILGSPTPSLESLYNAGTGLFAQVECEDCSGSATHYPVTVIDTVAERRKRGMSGDVSLKMLALVKRVTDSGGKVLAVSWEPQEQLQGADFVTPYAVRNISVEGYSLVALLDADSLLGRQDFRSDEHTLQLLRRLSSSCPLVLQTKEPGHPVFTLDIYPQMLQERMQFGYPPFTRLVKLTFEESDERRQTLRSRFLCNRIREVVRPYSDPQILGPEKGEIRILFKRDRNLVKGKEALYREICSFQQQYSCRITIDVDPV